MTYPQLSTGALSQYPARTRRRTRTVRNRTEDGRIIKLPDVAAQTTEWQLQYSSLSDSELGALQSFFTAMEGSLNGFTFLDPCGNLLAWSDDPTQTEWQRDQFLTLTGAASDPNGGKSAWLIANSGGASQGISQTLNVPGGYLYCLSVFLRADQQTAVTLSLGALSASVSANTTWSRFSVSGMSESSSSAVTFGFALGAGGSVFLYGPQVEPQESPSVYQSSTTGGVYQNARFRDDIFTYTSTDVNRHSTTVNIVYANHL